MKYVKIKYFDVNRQEYRTEFAIKTSGRRGCLLYRLVDSRRQPKQTIPKTLLVAGVDQLTWEKPAEVHRVKGVLVTPNSKYWKTRNEGKSILRGIGNIIKRLKT